jgi:hypothetical protein
MPQEVIENTEQVHSEKIVFLEQPELKQRDQSYMKKSKDGRSSKDIFREYNLE